MQIVEFCHIKDKFGIKSLNFVGGKNSSLGNMISDMEKLEVKVPNGFAITTSFYNEFIEANNIQSLINKLDKTTTNFESLSKEIRTKIEESDFSDDFLNLLSNHYQMLGGGDVAVRSSATAEDLDNASFAGQQDTYLNIS